MSSYKPWYTGAVMYQIYPRSFQDSNGDGVGDLNGIRQRLDYLTELGVDAIWISPFYPSPMKDFGYDISDYCNVDPLFGTLDDFNELLNEAHEHGVKVLVDLVPNHTSSEHAWFQESRSSRDNPKRDWYVWRDPKPGGLPPNNWISIFGGSAWAWDEATGQYYLHSFLAEQPDLNWNNPAVQKAMRETMCFWLDKGVDGFRVDAVDFLGKDWSFPDEPPNPKYKEGRWEYEMLDHKFTHGAGDFAKYLNILADTVGAYPGRVLVLETYLFDHKHPASYRAFYDLLKHPFVMPFNFELLRAHWQAKGMQTLLDDFQAMLEPGELATYALGNHDSPRLATRVGDDAARAAVLLLLGLPGMVCLYNGEEIGMRDGKIPREQWLDPAIGSKGANRDGCRTPMHWSAEPFAGFSTRQPWLPVDTNYHWLNVAAEQTDPDSMLMLYKRLIALRAGQPALRFGAYRPGPSPEHVVSYYRKYRGQTLAIFVNCSSEPVTLPGIDAAKLLISTDPTRTKFSPTLKPHEAVILDI